MKGSRGRIARPLLLLLICLSAVNPIFSDEESWFQFIPRKDQAQAQKYMAEIDKTVKQNADIQESMDYTMLNTAYLSLLLGEYKHSLPGQRYGMDRRFHFNPRRYDVKEFLLEQLLLRYQQASDFSHDQFQAKEGLISLSAHEKVIRDNGAKLSSLVNANIKSADKDKLKSLELRLSGIIGKAVYCPSVLFIHLRAEADLLDAEHYKKWVVLLSHASPGAIAENIHIFDSSSNETFKKYLLMFEAEYHALKKMNCIFPASAAAVWYVNAFLDDYPKEDIPFDSIKLFLETFCGTDPAVLAGLFYNHIDYGTALSEIYSILWIGLSRYPETFLHDTGLDRQLITGAFDHLRKAYNYIPWELSRGSRFFFNGDETDKPGKYDGENFLDILVKTETFAAEAESYSPDELMEAFKNLTAKDYLASELLFDSRRYVPLQDMLNGEIENFLNNRFPEILQKEKPALSMVYHMVDINSVPLRMVTVHEKVSADGISLVIPRAVDYADTRGALFLGNSGQVLFTVDPVMEKKPLTFSEINFAPDEFFCGSNDHIMMILKDYMNSLANKMGISSEMAYFPMAYTASGNLHRLKFLSASSFRLAGYFRGNDEK